MSHAAPTVQLFGRQQCPARQISLPEQRRMETIGTWWMWAGFAVFVVVAIAVDLLVM